MTKSGNQLEPWEVSIIKAMIASAKFKKQQIVAYFSRPDRSINQARISEIEDGHDRYRDIPIATDAELQRFLSAWKEMSFPGQAFEPASPVHPEVLFRRFPKRKSQPLRLNISETAEIEAKESFNWGNSAKYCRTLAGMANNRGGYLLFGVKDGSFEVVGIAQDRMENFDLAKANQFIIRSFNQALDIEKAQFEIDGLTIGVLHVRQSDKRPVICKITNKELQSGDIYFRYPGETRRIQEPELVDLLSELERSVEARFVGMMSRVGESGTNNSAILDLNSGNVSGQSGQFVIDESLLEKVKFISQGQFKEKLGAPTLKLIGDVRKIGSPNDVVRQEVIASVTERDIQEAFVNQYCDYEPATYIRAQPNLQPKWFPIFYFAKKAGLDDDGLIETLRKASTDYPARTAMQIARVMKKALPAGPPHPKSVAGELDAIYSQENIQIDDEDQANQYLKALRVVELERVETERVLYVLRTLWKRFGSASRLRANFRSAISSVDTVFFGTSFFV